MRLSRQSRFIAALFTIFSVFFAQLAVAAYACPSMQIAQAVESVAAAGSMHAMAGCEGMDKVKPLNCHDHAQTKSQSLTKPELPNVSPFMAAVLVQTILHADRAFPSLIPHSDGLFLTRTTAPPLSIRNCCFRI